MKPARYSQLQLFLTPVIHVCHRMKQSQEVTESKHGTVTTNMHWTGLQLTQLMPPDRKSVTTVLSLGEEAALNKVRYLGVLFKAAL